MSGGTPTPVNGPGTGLDIQRPNVARMYDYYMRGKDNFAADREAADKVLTVAPDVPHAARENHRFLTRAIQFLTGEAGIGQFIDIGPGSRPRRTSTTSSTVSTGPPASPTSTTTRPRCPTAAPCSPATSPLSPRRTATSAIPARSSRTLTCGGSSTSMNPSHYA